jgi:hypothetical protein
LSLDLGHAYIDALYLKQVFHPVVHPNQCPYLEPSNREASERLRTNHMGSAR